ncbi:RagB/SusD family nutrient uptake outer membrane protein [Niabella sp. CC-SYL272]|uniref:RagB/SusD family nutrient uptake outer membrane protein n=1 Tax=Niabella agricola TaxID=2891571 RepID=UPI001F1B01D2|nr:RagB/SusD family nutrient uptake outer membrane protein [Niabella agricola]MCF3112161.1 RagB/SusD family nutrient uptake outer membrane protein [Niabella agricola]
MKSRIIIIVIVLSALSISCKRFLDQIPDNILKEEDIFKSLVNTRAYLAQVYTNMPDDFSARFAPSNYAGPWTGASDEANYWSLSWVMSNSLNQSTWDNNVGGTYWINWYKPVRTATDFINKVDGANPNEVNPMIRMHYKGEARAMRALFYFWMLRLYGPLIILPKEVPVNGTGDEIFFKRSTFDECVNYIVGQLDSAYSEIKQSVAGSPQAADQPLTYGTTKEWGRVTTGVCKAYKFQVLMLAASPLFNGNKELASLKNQDGTQLINQTYDPNKWKLAIDAAKDFLNEFDNKTYSLYRESDSDPWVAAYKSCKNVMIKDWNSEWIFGKSMASAGDYWYDITPKLVGYGNTVGKGAGFLSVNQSMVDAYNMKNGYPITHPESGYVNSGFSDFKSPYDVKARSTFNQWVNREARFYVGVTYNRSYWQNQGGSSTEVIPVFELSGNSGKTQSSWDVTSTGYVVRKQLASSGDSRGWVHLRLAQIYLDYAEALNEGDPGNPDILKYLNLIRDRAGVAPYGAGVNAIPTPTGQDEMREAIRHERMVELAFENVRYFDIRRWKIAPQTMGADVYGMNVYADGNDFYKKTLVQKRRFLPRDYLWPIPNDEVLKDKYLVQNPGW